VNGETLAGTQAQASDKNQILGALEKTASEMRNKLGESHSSIQKFDIPLDQATTPSLEALKAFSTGDRVASTQGTAASISFFKRAIEFDPKFAMAYIALGTFYWTLREDNLASENTRKAFELRERVSEYKSWRSKQITISRPRAIARNSAAPASCGLKCTQEIPKHTTR
jgi:hypothetical protein